MNNHFVKNWKVLYMYMYMLYQLFRDCMYIVVTICFIFPLTYFSLTTFSRSLSLMLGQLKARTKPQHKVTRKWTLLTYVNANHVSVHGLYVLLMLQAVLLVTQSQSDDGDVHIRQVYSLLLTRTTIKYCSNSELLHHMSVRSGFTYMFYFC